MGRGTISGWGPTADTKSTVHVYPNAHLYTGRDAVNVGAADSEKEFVKIWDAL